MFLYLLSFTIAHYRGLSRTIADYRSAAKRSAAQRSAAVVEMPFKWSANFQLKRSNVKVTGRHSNLASCLITAGRSSALCSGSRLQGGRGLEFPSVTQPVTTRSTATYHVLADIFACIAFYVQYVHNRRAQKLARFSDSGTSHNDN